MAEQCDSCGKFCSRRSRLGEHPEYGLQVNYCHRCRNGGALVERQEDE